VVRNAKALCEGMKKNGFRIVSGTTENHVMLVDLQPKNITGKEVSDILDHAGITVNKNAIPYDTNPPLKPSGIRIGTPALTTRGMREAEMRQIAVWIGRTLENRGDDTALRRIHGEVTELANRFPLYAWRREPVVARA
jgi:glycine hydroxymethyltransferase